MPGRRSSKIGITYYCLICCLLCSLSRLAYSALDFPTDQAINNGKTLDNEHLRNASHPANPSPATTADTKTPSQPNILADKLSTPEELKQTQEHQEPKTKLKKELTREGQQQFDSMAERLGQLQENHGNFSVASSEVLLEMAQLYQQQNLYKEAEKLLAQAMQVQKINHGLYSSQQMPIAKLLVDNLIAQGKWNNASDKQEFRRWLANRSLKESPEEHMSVLLDLAQWQLHAYVFTGRRDHNHVAAAKRIYHQYLNLYGKNLERHHNSETLSKALQGYIASNYFLLKSKEQDVPSGFSVSSGRDSPFAQQQQEFQTLRSSIFLSGKKALKNMVHEANTPQDKMKQLLLSGDWFLLFGKSSSAKQLYRQAQELANKENLGPFFKTPISIPELPKWKDNFVASDKRHHVKATFDIGRDGRARNVRVDEKDIKLRGKIKRQLRKTHFRPVLDENGHFVGSRDIQQSFSFP